MYADEITNIIEKQNRMEKEKVSSMNQGSGPLKFWRHSLIITL